MKTKYLAITLANFSGILILIGLLAVPFYFATQVAKPANIAGAKITKPYIIISQIDKFPGLQFSQEAESYKVTFNKIAQFQAFTGVAQITNPTSRKQTYQIVSSNNSQVFFGEDINNQTTAVALPSGGSVPISVLSTEKSLSPQAVEFSIITN